MEIKLVATDMDGTFLDENHEFDQALFLKVLKEVSRKRDLLCGSKWSASPLFEDNL